jgi:predicted metal-dependent HD superfamily phosphohydrolase
MMHVLSCLLTAEKEFKGYESFDLMCVALWYHDAVYDPRRADNEYESYALFLQHAAKMGLVEHREMLSERERNEVTPCLD